MRCTRGGTLWALDRATFRAVLCGSKALTLTLTRPLTLTRTLTRTRNLYLPKSP